MTPQEIFEQALGYYEGRKGYEKSYAKAYPLFLEAAETGHVGAQSYVGRMLCMGEGVEIDRTTGFYWISQAAEKGHIKAMHNLGLCYYKGWGVEKDMEKAYNSFLASAEGGNIRAMVKVGDMLRDNKGVPRHGINNCIYARDWYKKAKDSSLAKHKLAEMYAGESLFEYNPIEYARHLYASNDLRSNLMIADMLMHGRGISADPYGAVKIWQYVYKQGYKFANYNLAVANYYGIGTDQNISKAIEYLMEVNSMDIDADTMYNSILQNQSNQFNFRLTTKNIDNSSILYAEWREFMCTKVQSITSTLEMNPSAESFFRLARLYQEDDLESNYEKSEEYFNKALEHGHPYALYIQSINKKRANNFADYNLYAPFYLDDIIKSCFPKNNNLWLMDKLATIYMILKGGKNIDDTNIIEKDWEKKLYSSVSKNSKVRKYCQALFELCQHKERNSLIQEYIEYIWESIERNKINTMTYPSMTFIDNLNIMLEDSNTICYSDKISLKLLKYIDTNKKHIFIVQDNKEYILGNLIVDILGLDCVSIKQDDDTNISCDTYVKFPDLRERKNHELDIRVSDLYQQECIMSSIADRKKIRKAIILVNREFCSSYMTELFFVKARLGRKRYIETVVEFNKDIFNDINTSTSLLVLNFEKQNNKVRFIKDGNETLVSYEKLEKNILTLSYDLYTQELNSSEGKQVVRFCDIMSIRTKFDKKDGYKPVKLTDKDYQSSLLGILGKKNSFTSVAKNPENIVSIVREFYGPHIFLTSTNGVKLNIQTDERLCNPGYEAHAIKLKKDSPVTIEYLAYLLTSHETKEYISTIVDKNGSFMPRDLLYKEIAIHPEKAIQNQVVEDSLIKERQASGSSVEYNVIIISPDEQKVNQEITKDGINFFKKVTDIYEKGNSFDIIFKKYIEDPSNTLIDAIIIDTQMDDHSDIFTYFNTIRDRNIHLYLLTSSEEVNLSGKRLKEYFIDGYRVFNCEADGWMAQLIRKLRDDLDSSNAYQAKIRNKYKAVFEAAESLDKKYPEIGIAKSVMRYIQTGCNIDDVDNVSGPCGSFRQVCHDMLNLMVKKNLVPKIDPGAIPSLIKDGKYYDSNKTKQTYIMLESFMPKYLSRSLEYFCKVTNEGVHGSQDSSRLGTAALNILMDFIVWFYEKDICNEDFENIPLDLCFRNVTKELIALKGVVRHVQVEESDNNRIIYAGNILIKENSNKPLQNNSKIKIKSINAYQFGEREEKRRRTKTGEYIEFCCNYDYDIL